MVLTESLDNLLTKTGQKYSIYLLAINFLYSIKGYLIMPLQNILEVKIRPILQQIHRKVCHDFLSKIFPESYI